MSKEDVQDAAAATAGRNATQPAEGQYELDALPGSRETSEAETIIEETTTTTNTGHTRNKFRVLAIMVALSVSNIPSLLSQVDFRRKQPKKNSY